VFGQQDDVFAPVTQRRDVDDVEGESIQQVSTKRSLLRQGRAIQFDERFLPARGQVVQAGGDQLLAGAKLADAKARQKALLMRHETGHHRLRVREQLHAGKVDDALMRFEKFERKVENIEGRVEAYDLGARPDLRQEIRNLEGEEKVELALNELKRRMSANRKTNDTEGDST